MRINCPSLCIEAIWLNGEGAPFSSYNPANGTVVWHGDRSSELQRLAAIQSNERVFPVWSKLSTEQRWKRLLAYKAILKERGAELTMIISQETGTPLWESKEDVQNALDLFLKEELFAQCKRASGSVEISLPFDTPAQSTHSALLPALLSGNTATLKPCDYTPATGEFIVRCWNESGLPPGVLNLIQGNGKPEVIDYNTLIVWGYADLSNAIKMTLQSSLVSSGQRRNNSKRLIIPSNEFGQTFLNALIKSAKQLKIGIYSSIPEPFMGPLISPTEAQRVYNIYRKLINEGATPLLEMCRHPAGASFLSPAIVEIKETKSRENENIAGPLIYLYWAANFKEAVTIANQAPHGFATAIIADDPALYEELKQQTLSDVVLWNRPTTAVFIPIKLTVGSFCQGAFQ